MIRHVVMMRWQDGTTDAQIQAVHDGLAAMPDLVPGIISYQFGSDLKMGEDNADFVLVAEFDSVDDYKVYTTHPDHLAVIEASIRPIVDSLTRVQYTP